MALKTCSRLADKDPMAMRFKPAEGVEKGLISTTSRIVGEYAGAGLEIFLAWPIGHDISIILESPVSRSGYVMALEVPSDAQYRVPMHSTSVETTAAYMSVLFGKRFDWHGSFEASGHFFVPDLRAYYGRCHTELAWNIHKPRDCFPVPLEMDQVGRLRRLLSGRADPARKRQIDAACRFYMQALQLAESNAEVAYLHLITVGEIISQLRVGRYKHEIGKNFTKGLMALLDDRFYVTNAAGEFHRFDPDSMQARITAAYALRSNYVHAGRSFGEWKNPLSWREMDILPGKPQMEDEELAGLLENAPMLVGLERLIRYCLLRLMESEGVLLGRREGNSTEEDGENE